MGYFDDMIKMFTDHLNSLNEFYNKNAELLNKESGDKGGESNPRNALVASDHFKWASDKLVTTHGEMVGKQNELKQWWTGPAAKAFTEVLKPIVQYVHDSTNHLAPQGDGPPAFIVNDVEIGDKGWRGSAARIWKAHKTAIDLHNFHWGWADYRYNELVKEANDEHLGRTAKRLDNTSDPYWYDSHSYTDGSGNTYYTDGYNGGRYNKELGEFETRRNYYSGELATNWTNHVDPVSNHMNNVLPRTYLDIIPELWPAAPLPIFPNNYKPDQDPVNKAKKEIDDYKKKAEDELDKQKDKADKELEKNKEELDKQKGKADEALDKQKADLDKQIEDARKNSSKDANIPGPSNVPGGGLPGSPKAEVPGGGLPGSGGPPLGVLPPNSLLPDPRRPSAGTLVTGPDGKPGLDLTGDGIPDVDLDGRPLPNGDLADAKLIPAPNGRGGLDLDHDGIPDVNFDGEALPGGSAPPGSRLAKGPNGVGFDVTGNRTPDVDINGNPLPGGDLPRGAKVVTGPDGVRGLDLDGDGVPDVDFAGHALPGGNAPPGSQLSTGPDGVTGFDVTGNRNPDVDINGNPLPDGDLPRGTKMVTGPDGVRGLDLNGDGLPDVDFAGHVLPGSAAPAGSTLVTGPDGTTAFDINGDGQPDVDLRGNPLPGLDRRLSTSAPPGLSPYDQVTLGPGFSGRSIAHSPGDGAVASVLQPSGPASDLGSQPLGSMGAMGPMGAMGGMGGMMHPMMGGQHDKNQRETWLQEEDDVWAGDDEGVPVATLGRQARRTEEDELPDSVWEEEDAAPANARAPRGGSRPSQRPPVGSSQRGLRR